MVATTLTVVSCLHRHASLDSMREVETVQPLAPPPISGRKTHCTGLLTSSNEILFRAGLRSDHKVQTLDDPRGHVLVTSQFDVLGAGRAHRAPAGQPGELQRVHPNSGRRLLSTEVLDHLCAPVDADPDAASQRPGQVEFDA